MAVQIAVDWVDQVVVQMAGQNNVAVVADAVAVAVDAGIDVVVATGCCC